MSANRYVPRKFTPDSKGFGSVEVARWPEYEFTPDQALASRMQHRWALAVREALEDAGLTVREYCRRNNVSYPRMSAILRGAAVARLEDIAAAYRHLGVTPPDDWLD